MMKNFNLCSERIAASCTALTLCLLVMAPDAQAVDVVFTATFQAPTCQVSAPPTLDFGSIQSATIKKGNSLNNPLALDITLSQCAGFMGTVKKTGVTVTGAGNVDAGDFLFRQPTSAAQVYGVRITTASGNVVANNGFVATALDSESFDGGSVVIPLKAALSCGNKCADAVGGMLTAAVTFNFAWQ
ncbi:TPA: type 1 fimbrial protein [Enterobacter mori]|uniref:fimbrial protein n=1 Tax=Enterobacter cloacae TaxID=550 RepID=UPI002FD19433|nr:type 1 fimbrial protein [Enterobacter mori]